MTTITSWDAPCYFHADRNAPPGLGTLREAVYLFIMTPPEKRAEVHVTCPKPIWVEGEPRDAGAEISRHDLETLASILRDEE